MNERGIQMNKMSDKNSYVKRAFAKYGTAICSNLYPLQAKKLKEALQGYDETGTATFDDNFVMLAFDLILCDLVEAAEQ